MIKNRKLPRNCRASTCFANIQGVCDALEYADDGYGDTCLCPFYKTKDDVEKGRIDALKRVVNKGRFDLIRKYRPTLEQTGVLDAGKAEDSFFDAHRADIEELQRLAYIEQEIRNGRVLTRDSGIPGVPDEWEDSDDSYVADAADDRGSAAADRGSAAADRGSAADDADDAAADRAPDAHSVPSAGMERGGLDDS